MTKSAAKVSIILPVYNAQKCIKQTLQYLINQTLKEIEIIAINDCSTDDSQQILTDLAALDSRITVVHHETNKGVHQARCTGLSYATGDYVGFIDADDIPSSQMFAKLYENAINCNADITICSVNWLTEAGKRKGRRVNFRKDRILTDELFQKFCHLEFGTGAFWNKLYRRELILKYGMQQFRWHQPVSEDTIVNIGCFYEAKKVCLLKEPLYGYVQNNDSATQNTSDSKMFVHMYRAFALALEQYKTLGDDALSKIAKLYQIQFNFQVYWLNSNLSLLPYNEQISEATSVINEVFPAGLTMLLNRKEKNEVLSYIMSNKYIIQNIRALAFELRKRFKY